MEPATITSLEEEETPETPVLREQKIPTGEPIAVRDPSTPKGKGAQVQHTPKAPGGVRSLPYSYQEVQLLASKGVSYNPQDGSWVKVTPQGSGNYVENVNPDAVLIQARAERTQASYMNNIADETLKNLSLTTQAILKKVTLNPCVPIPLEHERS